MSVQSLKIEQYVYFIFKTCAICESILFYFNLFVLFIITLVHKCDDIIVLASELNKYCAVLRFGHVISN